VVPIFTAALTIAAVGGLARGVAVIYGWVRTFLVRKRFVSFRFGWIEILTNFEPPVLLVASYFLYQSIESTGSPTPARTLVATLGAALLIIGWAFQIWAFLSWPSLFAGHGVLDDHRLLTRGAYAVVRHPVYLGAFLVWLGLGLAFSNAVVLAIAIVYVIPMYVLYLRAEEGMMLESFGEAYRNYALKVPMLVPRLGRKKSGTREQERRPNKDA
jgi:protein-S-isoprenylcysteine O-methyltransferase Ste14